ncbi:MAG: DNA mismatch repair protein MutS, partial [Planctomycetota bacterium]
ESSLRAFLAEGRIPVAAAPREAFGERAAEESLRELLRAAALGGFGFEEGRPSLGAAGGLVAYLRETQVRTMPAFASVRRVADDDRLIVDGITLRNLEITEGSSSRSRDGSLLEVLDRTHTAMGARTLKGWISAPPRRPADVRIRQETVACLVSDPARLEKARAALRQMPDLERLAVRAATDRSRPRELGGIREALRRLPSLRAAAAGAEASLGDAVPPEDVSDVCDLLERSLEETLPNALADGNVVREGFDPEIDRLRANRKAALDAIAALETAESARLGVPNLKVGFNEIHGYYLEVTNAHRSKVPPEYVRKGGVKNAERWTMPALRERELEISRAKDRISALEREAFLGVRRKTGEARDRLLAAAASAGRFDAAASLAAVARDRGWVRPEISDEPILEIRDGRHPVLDSKLPPGTFVPNDAVLDARAGRFVILTGPNMAGKSTYIRQVALLALLAHAGSYVPAASARVGWVDRLFSRVGAQDDLSRGRSTFLVEMEETAHILRHATDRSLVILDEVGRGTSTYDGVAIAWAVTEHLLERVRCRCLFATHYHELTRLADERDGARNFHVAVRELADGILFLHRILPGGTDRSYGVQVATLAGLPAEVVERAKALLAVLESGRRAPSAGKPEPSPQKGLFG